MLLVGMMFARFRDRGLLMDYSATMLVQVIQGCAVLTIILNVIALWKQEARNYCSDCADRETPGLFSDLWQSLRARRAQRPVADRESVSALQALLMQGCAARPLWRRNSRPLGRARPPG